MAEQAEVPEIRFAGFTDPWEQRKLGDVAPLQRGFDLPVNQMTPGPYPVVMSNGIGGWHSKYMVKGPGVVTGRSGTIGSLHYIEQNFWPHNTSLWVTSFNGNEPRFIYWLYASIGLERFGSGSGVPTLNRNDVHDLRVGFPCDVAEQRRIGTFFSRLDSLITLHQRKYDKLVVFKKSMLEKMFPKDGESVPEIRFAGFTDPWEQRKLGELEKDATLYMGRGRVISAKDMSNTPGTFPVYSSSALDNGRMGAYGKYMFNQELITWSIDGGGAVFYRRKHRFSVTNVSGYIAVNPEKINCKFLAYAMSLAHSRIKFDYTVKAHPSVIRSLYTMGIPISLQEQQVIGSFFSRLDNLITLHQRKLELLRNIKKSLLDKMFA